MSAGTIVTRYYLIKYTDSLEKPAVATDFSVGTASATCIYIRIFRTGETDPLLSSTGPNDFATLKIGQNDQRC